MSDRTFDNGETTSPSEPEPDEPRIRTGSTIDGYMLDSLLGRGGLSDVYAAHHPSRGGRFALKIAKGRPASVTAHRFQREAKILMQLEHPNIVSGIDAGMIEGSPYIVMPLLEGETLHALVRREGSLSVERARDFTIQLARGLAAAHDALLVHRDLKPLNVIVTPGVRETLRILDFGIAQAFDGEQMRTRLTGGGLTGTPHYMAPEQILVSKDVSPATDLYALGGIVCVMLTGKPPFAKPMPMLELLRAQVKDPPPDLSAYGQLGVLATKMLAKAPSDRPGSAREIVDALVDESATAYAMAPVILPTTVVEDAPTHAMDDAPALSRGLMALLFSVVAIGVAAIVSVVASDDEVPVEAVTPAPQVVAAPAVGPAKPTPQVVAAPVVEPAPRVVPIEPPVEAPPPPPARRRPPRKERVRSSPPAERVDVPVEVRLEKLRKQLTRLAEDLPEARFAPLEHRYLELLERATKSPNDARTKAALDGLERDTRRLTAK